MPRDGTSVRNWSRSASDSGTACRIWYSVSVRKRCIGSRFRRLGDWFQRVQLELVQPVFFAEELLGNIGQDGVLPDARDPGVVEVGAHEVAGSDGGVRISQPPVGLIDAVREPFVARLVARQPAAQQTLN